jgi:hypothetical protein
MCESLRKNMQPLLLYDVNCTDPAKSWSENKYDMSEWRVNNQSAAVLSSLGAASQILEGNSYPTLNMVLPYIYGCIAGLADGADTYQPWDRKLLKAADLCPEVKEARAALHADLQVRWIDELPRERWVLYVIATLLDPRTRGLAFPLVTDEMRADARREFLSEYELNWAPIEQESEQEADVPQEQPTEPGLQPMSMGSYSDFLGSVAHLMPTAASVPVLGVLSEAENYLQIPPVQADIDLLQWWAEHEEVLPHLSRMARQFLGCPATSASAERVFSLAGRLYGDLTQAMNDVSLEERMWAKVNAKPPVQ